VHQLLVEEAMMAHKNQYKVEHAYRRSKSGYQLEPIYLHTPERIEAYLFLFKMALQVVVLIERTARKNIEKRDKGSEIKVIKPFCNDIDASTLLYPRQARQSSTLNGTYHRYIIPNLRTLFVPNLMEERRINEIRRLSAGVYLGCRRGRRHSLHR
jgi:hypothetical protein